MRKPIGVKKHRIERIELHVKMKRDEFDKMLEKEVNMHSVQMSRKYVVPIAKDSMKELVMCFLKASRYPRKNFVVYESGTQLFKIMQFNGYVVLFKWNTMSVSYEVYFSSGVEKWLRFNVLKNMWLVDSRTKKYALGCHTIEQLKVLQGVWLKWEEDRKKHVVFGSWMLLSKNDKLRERLQKKLSRFSPRRASMIAAGARERRKGQLK